ncbi:MAG: tetratricopeptide repeat protein [Algibacter sp.]|uniref:tetratricopeptide repeat protein n=1 Tax=Algibacter sp. TaxID=1872428 RepID=UPI00329721FE
MKQFIFLMILLWGLNSYSQNYESNYKTDICACIEAEQNTRQLADNIYNACFAKHMITYADLIDSQINEADKTKKFITGQQVRRDLNQKFKYELANVCDAYVDIIESKKRHLLQEIRTKKIDSSRIDQLNQTVAMVPNYYSYFNRGQYYYYIGDLNKAERDVKKSIEDNPLNQNGISTPQESLLLALIYEEQKKYSEAIAIYNAINTKAINPSIELLKTIVYRKSNGYVLTTKNVEDKKVESIVAKETTEKITVNRRQRTATRISEAKTEQKQNNTTPTTIAKKQTTIKSKDSTKNLRGLFKLD